MLYITFPGALDDVLGRFRALHHRGDLHRPPVVVGTVLLRNQGRVHNMASLTLHKRSRVFIQKVSYCRSIVKMLLLSLFNGPRIPW